MLSILILILVLVLLYNIKTVKKKMKHDYKCFLLTVKSAKERQNRFFKYHDTDIPIEVIYGPDTRSVKVARKFEYDIEPEYFEKAIEMHYNPTVPRPDITYFNLGAIGCFMGHMEFYKRCFNQGIKYAVIFEDNVIVKSNLLYDEIQKVIDEKGDDFEMYFFHCLSRLPESGEKVKWISSTKCYLINVSNMEKYHKYFYPMDNHIDMKHEDLIAKGARVYYRDLRKYIHIDRSHTSTIGHRNHGNKTFFSRQYPMATPDDVERGY
jgi:hypothetical protein